MNPLFNTLFVTNADCYVRLEGQTVCVEQNRQKLIQIPIHHLTGLVCVGEISVTAPLLQQFVAEGRSVSFLDRNGRFMARVEGPRSGNVLLRLDQFRFSETAERCENFARMIVAGKLQNSRQVLMRSARETTDQSDQEEIQRSVDLIKTFIKRLPETRGLDAIRGLEGNAAKAYFDVFTLMLKPEIRDDFRFNGRNRRPPMDRLNATISFLYAVLMHDCRTALETIGLDPQIGFFHALRPGRASLALDLMEEFRPWLCDRLAITLLNRGQLKKKHFLTRDGGAVLLNDEGRKELITSYQKRKQEEKTHQLLNQRVQIGLLPHLQARLLARLVRGDISAYPPFLDK